MNPPRYLSPCDNGEAKIFEGNLDCCIIVLQYNKDTFQRLWKIAPSRNFFLKILKVCAEMPIKLPPITPGSSAYHS
jgi:hypothetical protein